MLVFALRLFIVPLIVSLVWFSVAFVFDVDVVFCLSLFVWLWFLFVCICFGYLVI